MMRVITFKIDDETIEKLDWMARIKGVTRSDLIRKAIRKLIQEEDGRSSVEPKIVRIWA